MSYAERNIIPRALYFPCVYVSLLLVLATLIGLLPIRFPNVLYADWQYAKRHGLLDDNGNIDQEAYENHADRREFW